MNLKQKIKDLIRTKKPDDTLLQELSNLKTKLINATNVDYEVYNKLSNIEHSIYRYNNFLKNGMHSNANSEAKNLMNLSEDNTTVLQGGISNIKYIWHTEPNACEKCQELDGTEYKSKEDIPEKPHPNCKCYVEEVKDDEVCDCLDDAQNKFIKMFEKVTTLQTDLHEMINELIYETKSNVGQSYNNLCQTIIDEAATWDNAVSDFARNYNDMLDADWKYSDKYFHAKANCQATKRGGAGEIIAETVSILREIEEGIRKVIFEGNNLTEQIKDAKQDMKANKYGRQQGKRYPEEACEILIDVFRPSGLPDKY